MDKKEVKQEGSLAENVNEFLSEQQIPTEEKIFTGATPQQANDNLGAEVAPGDFKEAAEAAEEIAEIDQAEKTQGIPFDAAKEAKLYTSFIDVTQRSIFTGAYKLKANKKLGGRKVWNKAVNNFDLTEGNNEAFDKLSEDDKKRVNLVKKTLEKIEKLPLDESEKEIWVEALESVIEENGKKMPPSLILFIATINMLVPRSLDLMID